MSQVYIRQRLVSTFGIDNWCEINKSLRKNRDSDRRLNRFYEKTYERILENEASNFAKSLIDNTLDYSPNLGDYE